MNESSIKYAAYKSLIEGKITQGQYDFITEVGVLKMLGSGIKNFVKSLKTGAEAVKSSYDEEQFQSIGKYAEAEVKKIVDQIKKVGKKLNKSNEEVAGVVAAVLQQAMGSQGIDARALTAVKQAGVADGNQAQGGKQLIQGQTLSLPKDTSVTVDQSPAAQAVVATAADVSGADKAQNLATAIQKKLNLEDALNVLYKVVSKKSGVDVGPVKKIIDYMFDNDLLELQKAPKTESRLLDRRSMKIKQLNRVLQRVASAKPRGDALVFERWQSLAGLEKAMLLRENEHDWKSEAEDLAAGLRQKTAMYDGFKNNLAKALKMSVEDLEDQIGNEGLEGVIAKIAAKKPDAVENAAESVGAEFNADKKQADDKQNDANENPVVKSGIEKISAGTKINPDQVKPVAMAIWDTDTVAPKAA